MSKKLTDQEVLNIVVKHLRQQKVRCINDIGICLYRNDKGHKCAAGALIPDDQYDPGMESQSCNSLRFFCELVEDTWFLRQLQKIHDSESPDSWEEQFLAIANEYGIDMPALTEAEQS